MEPLLTVENILLAARKAAQAKQAALPVAEQPQGTHRILRQDRENPVATWPVKDGIADYSAAATEALQLNATDPEHLYFVATSPAFKPRLSWAA